MKEERIDILVKKFYAAELTPVEESELLDSLLKDGKREEYGPDYDIIVASLVVSDDHTPDVQLDERLLAGIEKANRHSRIRTISYISGIAATILIFFSTFYLMKSNVGFKDTYNDPVIAYNETIKVLQEVSTKLKKGTQALEKLNKINETNDLARNQIEKPLSVIIENMNHVKLPEDKK